MRLTKLLDKVEAAILERLPVAESFEPHISVRERKYKYYRIYVDNYTIYYVVIDDDPFKKRQSEMTVFFVRINEKFLDR